MPVTPILFCSHVVEMGGAEVVLTELLAELDRERFQPHLAVPGSGPLADRCAALGVPVHRIQIGGANAWQKAASVPGAARALRRVAAATGCQILVANSMIAGYAAVLAQHRALRCVWHLHSVPQAFVARFAIRRAAHVIAPSRAGLLGVGRAFAASERATTIHNGVHERFFSTTGRGLRQRLGVPIETPLIGMIGRLDPRKGHDVLVQAHARWAGPRAPHLVLVGGELFAGSLAHIAGFAEQLRQRIAQLGTGARVHWLGEVADTAPLLAELDVVAVPSIALESAPRTIAEAQAAGCAVVASAIGGTPELITHEVSGLLVPPGDVDALGRALARALDDTALRERMRAGGLAVARANYRMATFARRCEQVLERVLAGRN